MKKNIKNGAIKCLKSLVTVLVLAVMILPVSSSQAATVPKMTADASLQTLLASLRSQALTEREQVAQVNTFFNRIPRSHDSATWGRKDYWATPAELLQRRRGDCEDVAIAKYFTLRRLGIGNERLRLAYGKIVDMSRGVIEPHMVLIYMPDASVQLILDNLSNDMLRISARDDLVIEYIFNTDSVWRWQKNRPVLLGRSDVIEPWHDLLLRL